MTDVASVRRVVQCHVCGWERMRRSRCVVAVTQTVLLWLFAGVVIMCCAAAAAGWPGAFIGLLGWLLCGAAALHVLPREWRCGRCGTPFSDSYSHHDCSTAARLP